ncbi:MAG TPA: PD-(D/E)XK nuclease family protein [Actinomycetes bacterium]|nr:PD-(D/E)XK nuclease family protein [Actinomycetes bacterium]
MTASQPELALEGLPKRLFACTPTRLTTWLDCRRRYRFTYLDRPQPPKGPPWAHNSVGSAVHLAMAGWHRLDPAARTPEAAARLLDQVWLHDGFRNDEQSERWRDRAREMVASYTSTLDPDDEPLGVERTVGTRTSVLALSGRVDRLDHRVVDGHEQVVVVDYKTGRRLLTSYDARSSLALALYALAVTRTLRRPCFRVELHHLPSGEVLAHDHTAESLQRHLSRAESLGEEAAAADSAYRDGLDYESADRLFPPDVSPSCRWCDFLRVCPAGSAAVRPAEPWAGLAEPVA